MASSDSDQPTYTCLACERSFWDYRSYRRHSCAGKDRGERFGTGGRQTLTAADLAAAPAIDPLELEAER